MLGRLGLLLTVLTFFITPAFAASSAYLGHLDRAREYESCGLPDNALAEYRAAARMEESDTSFAADQAARLEYTNLKNRLQLRPAPTPTELSADSDSWCGIFFECRGTVEAFNEKAGSWSIFVAGTQMSFIAPHSVYMSPGKAIVFIARIPHGSTDNVPEIVALAAGELIPEDTGEGSGVAVGAPGVIYEAYVPVPQPVSTAAPSPKLNAAHARRVAASSVRPAASSEDRTKTAVSGRPQVTQSLIDAYTAAVKHFNPRLKTDKAGLIAEAVLRYSIRQGVDPRLIMAVIAAESNFRPSATSPAGAAGLGQLMPATAAGLGIRDRYDPEQSIMGAVRVMKGHLDKWEGEERDLQHALALASYNAGPGAVRKYGGVPPYRETQNYIRRVLRTRPSVVNGR